MSLLVNSLLTKIHICNPILLCTIPTLYFYRFIWFNGSMVRAQENRAGKRWTKRECNSKLNFKSFISNSFLDILFNSLFTKIHIFNQFLLWYQNSKFTTSFVLTMEKSMPTKNSFLNVVYFPLSSKLYFIRFICFVFSWLQAFIKLNSYTAPPIVISNNSIRTRYGIFIQS